MEVNRLSRDELEYELSVRGVENTSILTIQVMRQELVKKFKREEIGDLTDQSTTARDPSKELDICAAKFKEVRALGLEFSGKSTDGNFKKISTKLIHIINRLCRIETSEAAELKGPIKVLLVEIREFEQEFIDRVDENDNAETKINVVETVENNKTRKKQIPVSQWNITFNGETGLSVNAFLELVNDYRVSRNISEDELCNCAVELLKGRALTWYRSMRHKIKSWDEFVKQLREEYEPYDYEVELWEEIRNRTQGQDESIGAYFACMINLFSRLPTKPSEEQKLQVLRRNIAPYYIHAMGLQDIHTVDKLREICKKLEDNRLMADKFHPPPSARRNLLEPDLSYQGRARVTHVNTSEVRNNSFTQPRSQPTCWNCRKTGHLYRDCGPPLNKFCYGCGLQNYTKATCTRCNNSGNGSRSSSFRTGDRTS